MQIICPQCNEPLVYEQTAPKFCQHCGFRLNASSVATDTENGSDFRNQETDSIVSMATVPPTNQSLNVPGESTIPPQSRPEPAKAVPTGIGQVIGPYRTTDWLGAGGMGNVWQAVEIATGRRVALKQLSSGMADEVESIQRFAQEAQLAAKISHPNVTFIYGTGSHESAPYIAMELMPGQTLEDEVKKSGPLSVPNSIDKILDVIDGLNAIHEKGMIHRDIKPSNCFIAANGHIKVGDFGLSKSVVSENASLTKTGTFMGTPSYASPEQIRGLDIDARTDMYSVGATLFFVLTGQTPYQGDATSMMAQIIGDPPPSIRDVNEKLPADLDLIIRKTMSKDPENRFASLSELRAALLPYASHFDSVADAGRRFAAYMIDQSGIQILGFALLTVAAIGTIVVSGKMISPESSAPERLQIAMSTIMFFVTLLYFAISEGIFSRSIGKWLMGLKLVNTENQKASLLQTTIRAMFVPAGLGLSLFVLWIQFKKGTLTPSTNPVDFVNNLLFGLAITYGPVLLCLLTMRRSNRLLGLHGIFSGTRVIRAAQVVERAKFPVSNLHTKMVPNMIFGPYHCDQLLGESEDGRVYLAEDDELQRNVWIVTRNSVATVPDSHMNMARPSRQRWLEGGNCSDETADGVCRRWDAFESVQGMPIQQVVATGTLDHSGRHAKLLREMVVEMIESINDKSLPENVRLAQVWVTEEGRLKLVVNSLVDSVAVSNKDSRYCPISGEAVDVSLAPVEQAVELVQQLGDVILRRSLRNSLREFLTELDQKDRTIETLEWANEQLKTLEKKTTSLTWDIRLGILSMTIGTEALIFLIVSTGWILASYYLTAMTWSFQLILGALLSLVLPMGLAAYFKGGLIFRVMGIQVCEKSGLPASPLQNAIRAGISWFPFIALVSSVSLLLIFADARAHELSTTEEGTVDFEVTHNRALVMWAIATMFVSMLLSFVGVMFSIFSPKRGITDYLLGTRLMPD